MRTLDRIPWELLDPRDFSAQPFCVPHHSLWIYEKLSSRTASANWFQVFHHRLRVRVDSDQRLTILADYPYGALQIDFQAVGHALVGQIGFHNMVASRIELAQLGHTLL